MLRKALVAEAVCTVDTSDSFYIHNPYGSQPTAAIQALTGTYSVSAFTVTDDSLTVTDEVIYGEHVFDFERVMNNYNLMLDRMDDIAYSIKYGIDYFVVNVLCEDGTGTYTTAAGGFTTAANINKIIADLSAKVMGYAEIYNGLFLILENSDITGVLQAEFSNGFSFADSALNNGFVRSYGGVDIYVVRDSTFVTTTIGSRSDIANSGHRVFGVKKVATYAAPRGVQYTEKEVSGKTGKEIAAWGYVGAKVWAQKAALIVDITVTA